MQKTLTRLQAKELITSLKNGTIYSVKFVKKDGTERLMNSIKGTSKGVKGVGLKFDAEERNLIPVYDIQLAKKDPANPDKCWRMVNVETLLEVSVNHQTYKVEG
jgi:hypothetical protein